MSVRHSLPYENIIHRTGSSPFSLHHTVVAGQESCALYLHCHPEAEFFYLKKGEILFYVENQSFHLQAGDAIFIPPNLIHNAQRSNLSAQECEYEAVVFSVDMLSDRFTGDNASYFSLLRKNRMESICPIYAADVHNAQILNILPALFAYRNQPLETYELALTGMLYLCFQELYNHYFSLKLKDVPGREATDMQKSIDFMMEHFDQPLTLSHLAKASGFSEGYYSHCFKRFTGYAPFEYLNRIRIVKSCALLSGTDKKITEIAFLCGFNNISYFNRTFVKIIGATPSAYRRNAHI